MKSTLGLFAMLAVAVIAQHASAQNATPPATPKKGAAAAAATETLSSGVGIKHLTVGTGASPGPTDTVKVHYRGTLADGKEFDSSFKRGQPATFPLDRVVPCWTQGLQKLKVGGKATLTCPPSTAYGSRGIPNVIPPDSTLTFEVELLAIGG
jgi:FKBP-type peptidyl-prolyl cis-trans isomerase FkpA